VDPRQAGRELGARYLLQGTVRRSRDTLRITAQLLDSATAATFWSDKVEGPLEDVFALQDRLTRSVVGAIMPTLEQAEIRRASSRPTASLGAYEQYLAGLATMYQMDRKANEASLLAFRRAIAIDPLYGLAYARGAECFALMKQAGWIDRPEEQGREACDMARRAVEVARDDALVLAISGFVMAYVGGELDAGNEQMERSLTLSANIPEAWAWSAWIQTCFGNHDVAIERALHAMRLSPLDSRAFRWKMFLARACLYAARYEEAADWAARSLADQPEFLAALRMSAAANALAGRMEVARAAVQKLTQRDPALRLSTVARTSAPYRPEANRDVVVRGLRLAGLPE
jgi:tetratricopeptide (TPR) repeat protein